MIGLVTRDAAGELLAGHGGKGAGFADERFGVRAIGGDDTAERAGLANMTHECARVQIPDDGNVVALEVSLSRFAGAPARGNLREIADDERFDIGARRFLVLGIGADVADVRIRQADNLAGIAGIGEDFLIAGEAGIKNNFSAAAATGAGRAAVKYSSVLERDERAVFVRLLQRVLREESFSC